MRRSEDCFRLGLRKYVHGHSPDVAVWPLADTLSRFCDVRFGGESGYRLRREVVGFFVSRGAVQNIAFEICERVAGSRVVSLRFAPIVFALFLPVTLCVANAASDFDNLTEVKTLQKGMPMDVAAFISKSAECTHWGNEEPYDKERAEFIRNAALKAGCSRLDGEEIQLRRKYRKNPKVLEIIEKAKNLAM